MKTAATTRALGPRKHKLLTQADIKRIPDLYAGDGKDDTDRKVPVKLFSPYLGYRWYCLEGEVLEDGDIRLYTWMTGAAVDEFGYTLLSELEAMKGMGGRLPLVERDKWWDHNITLAQVWENEAES
jgi:Protein of unknown function (DUF2958)